MRKTTSEKTERIIRRAMFGVKITEGKEGGRRGLGNREGWK